MMKFKLGILYVFLMKGMNMCEENKIKEMSGNGSDHYRCVDNREL